MKTRRKTLIGLASTPLIGLTNTLAGCQFDTAPDRTSHSSSAWGYSLFEKGQFYGQSGFGGFNGRAFTLDTAFRVAAVTKMTVAELARRLHTSGDVDLDGDISDLIGVVLRHPNHPSKQITLRHILSHRSAIRDPQICKAAHPKDIRSLLKQNIWEAGGEPGVSFRYSDFAYCLAATAIETALNERFDRLFHRHIAEPSGLDIGLNWSGVSQSRRVNGMPGLLNRKVQVDDVNDRISEGPSILIDDGASLDTYSPGQNGTLFSPHGGLRASLSDIAILTDIIIRQQPELWEPRWRWDGNIRANGPSDNAHFVAFGEGLYIYPNGPLGRDNVTWIGHHGSAYGINCGTWFRADPNRPGIFVHAVLYDNSGISGMTGFKPNNSRAAFRALGYGTSSLRLLAEEK